MQKILHTEGVKIEYHYFCPIFPTPVASSIFFQLVALFKLLWQDSGPLYAIELMKNLGPLWRCKLWVSHRFVIKFHPMHYATRPLRRQCTHFLPTNRHRRNYHLFNCSSKTDKTVNNESNYCNYPLLLSTQLNVTPLSFGNHKGERWRRTKNKCVIKVIKLSSWSGCNSRGFCNGESLLIPDTCRLCANSWTNGKWRGCLMLLMAVDALSLQSRLLHCTKLQQTQSTATHFTSNNMDWEVQFEMMARMHSSVACWNGYLNVNERIWK